MGISDLVPLTVEQGRLAADPASLRLAARIAARFGRAYPPLADEFASEAPVALCQAARSYDPAAGVAFGTHAACRVAGAMRDVRRLWKPKGYRYGLPGCPAVHSLDTAAPFVSRAGPDRVGSSGEARWGETKGALLVDDVPGVGWEIEYHDEVAGLARRTPRGCGVVLIRLHGHAATIDLAAAARYLGLSRSRVQQMHAAALDRLAERFEEGDMVMRGNFGGRTIRR
jgi:hypothetical protein